MTPRGNAELRVYAVEADPSKCTASFPTFDSPDEAFAAAEVPAFTRDGLPPPRVLVRRGQGVWVPACGAPTWHGRCGLMKGHDLDSAFHKGAHDYRCLSLTAEPVYDDGTPNPCDCRILRMIDAGPQAGPHIDVYSEANDA